MKKHTRFLALLAAFMVTAALFVACAAPAPTGVGNNTGGKLQEDPVAAPAEGAKADDGSTLPVVDPGSAENYGKKVIYTVSMSIEAMDAAKAVKDISAMAAEMGGYVSDMQYDAKSDTGWITVRIQPEKYVKFTEQVGSMGKVLDHKLGSQDVTDGYYDVQSRLTNAQFQEKQLQDIMEKAVKIDDILKVRMELNTVQQEIEQYKGQLRLWDNQVGFSTVTISVQQPAPPAVVVEPEDENKGTQFWGFDAIWQKIARGASDSFNWTLNAIGAIFIALSYIIVPLIIIAIVVVAIIFIVKAASKKKKKV